MTIGQNPPNASRDDAIRAAEEWLLAANEPGADPKDRPRAAAALAEARRAKFDAKKQAKHDAEAYRRRPAAPYPVEALGTVLSRAATAITDKVKCPPALAANSVLAVASLAAQGVANVSHPEGHLCSTSLFALTIALSGERKTTAANHAMGPVRARELELRKAYAEGISIHERELATWISQHNKIVKSKTLTREQQDQKLEALGDQPMAPRRPMLTVSDATQEGIIKAFQTLPPALGLFSNEGGQVLCGFGFKQENKIATAAVLSSLWDGGDIRRLRAGAGAVDLHNRRLAVHLQVQPDIATAFLTDRDIGGQGFTPASLWRSLSPTSATAFCSTLPRSLICGAPLTASI
jgi:Protein of unknown function (DUF3987)